MGDTPETPVKKCERCNAPPLKKPDPDGGRRCFAHSTAPETVAKRQACAEAGAKTAANVRGIPRSQRLAVAAGAVSIDQARAERLEGMRSKKREEMAEVVDPIDLGSKSAIQAYLGKEAGRLTVTGDAQVASAAATIARTALAVLGYEEETAPDEEVVGWRVERVDRNTKVRADA